MFSHAFPHHSSTFKVLGKQTNLSKQLSTVYFKRSTRKKNLGRYRKFLKGNTTLTQQSPVILHTATNRRKEFSISPLCSTESLDNKWADCWLDRGLRGSGCSFIAQGATPLAQGQVDSLDMVFPDVSGTRDGIEIFMDIFPMWSSFYNGIFETHVTTEITVGMYLRSGCQYNVFLHVILVSRIFGRDRVEAVHLCEPAVRLYKVHWAIKMLIEFHTLIDRIFPFKAWLAKDLKCILEVHYNNNWMQSTKKCQYIFFRH